MDTINNILMDFDEKEDILARSIKIQKISKTNPNVINATLGTLYNEDGTISVLNSVKKVRKSLRDEDIFPYSSTLGPNDFSSLLVDFLFKDHIKEMLDKKSMEVIPTPGATGALNMALFMSLNAKETVILPKICWNVYFTMCKTHDLNYVTYDYIKDNHFDLDGFIKCVDEISKKQKHIVTILNDPCNNPTGYSLTKEEFQKLIDYINSRKDLKFTLIYDVAYYEFSLDNSREKFLMLKELKDNALTIITWSASKAFTMYGLRLGALIFIDSFSMKTQKMLNICKIAARANWSCVGSEALNIITSILKDKETLIEYEKEIMMLNEMLQKRVKLFMRQAKEVNLDVIPYRGGFFIAINSDNPKLLSDELEKENVFVIAMNDVIRIAICGITYDQCDGLPLKIKRCIERIK